MADRVKVADAYQVGAADVVLSLSIGEGQIGTSDVSLGGNPLLRATGSIGHLRIGSGPAVKGKKLLVKSVVNDVSSMTNKMSVTYRLTGGKGTKVLTTKGSVNKAGAMLVFETTIALS